MDKLHESLSQQSIDKLLDKINEQGYEFLSDKEKEMLKNPGQFTDFELDKFTNIIYNEKYTKRIKVFDDEKLHISVAKFINEKKEMTFFLTFKELNENNPLSKLVLVINLNEMSTINEGLGLVIRASIDDIYGNDIFSEDYTDYINENINDNQQKIAMDLINKSMQVATEKVISYITGISDTKIDYQDNAG